MFSSCYVCIFFVKNFYRKIVYSQWFLGKIVKIYFPPHSWIIFHLHRVAPTTFSRRTDVWFHHCRIASNQGYRRSSIENFLNNPTVWYYSVLYHRLRRVCIRSLPLSFSPLPPPSRLKFFPCRFALRWLYYLDSLIRLGDIRGKQWLIQGPPRVFFCSLQPCLDH